MALSLNQVEHTARKAVRGSGLPWGLAEDAGRAVRWLEMLDLPGMLWLSQLLDQHPHDRLESLRVTVSDDEWHAIGGSLSPLLVGPSLMDWLGMQRQASMAAVTLHDVPCAGLCVGYLALAVSYLDIRVDLEGEGFRLTVSTAGVDVQGDDMSALCTTFRQLVVTAGTDVAAGTGRHHAPRVGSRDIDPCALGMLESLAHKTYVEASEASRLSGAGAGLQDND